MQQSEISGHPLTLQEIRQLGGLDLETTLRNIDSEHADCIDYIQEVRLLREKSTKRTVISIYFDPRSKTYVMVCNICNEYQHIAMQKATFNMINGGCTFDFQLMNEHLKGKSHEAVWDYILTMQYKDRLLQHEFGGSSHIINKLAELNEKMRDEIVDEKIAKDNNEKDNNDNIQKHATMLQSSKPPLYPFDQKAIVAVKKRLGESLAFSIDQNQFVENIIHQAVSAVRDRRFQEDSKKAEEEDKKVEDKPKKENEFKLIADINSIPSVLSDLPFVNKVLQVISITQPIIMKRLFQALIRESEFKHSHNKEEPQKNRREKEKKMQHIRELFESALKTTKMTIMDDIKLVDQMQDMHQVKRERKDDDSLKLFSAHNNNINVNNWKYRGLDLSLLFDIYSIYRIDQYILLGKFETIPARLRELCGGTEDDDLEENPKPYVDNNINVDEATVFQRAIRYYMTHIVSPIKLCKSWVVDGDVTEYMTYVFALSSYLNELLKEHSDKQKKQKNIGALQFDLVLIVESHHIFSAKRSDNRIIADLNLVDNLKAHKVMFVRREVSWDNSTDRNYIQSEIEHAIHALLKRLKMDKTSAAFYNKRFVVLIDKRRGEEHDANESDVLYVFESMQFIQTLPKHDSIGLDNDAIMHYLTQKYLVPLNKGEWFGAMQSPKEEESQNAQLFTFSFHIHTLNAHRCYFYYNGGCTRTFPEHFVNLIPKYFRYPVKKYKKEVKKEAKKDMKKNLEFRKEFIKILYSNDYKHGFDLVLKDPLFNKWYRMITGLFHITVNYRRVKVVSQSSRSLKMSTSISMVFAKQKTVQDLNKEEFCHIVMWFLKLQQIEVDSMKLKHAVIDVLQLDGESFANIKRKTFGKELKQIGIAQGKASKLYKQMKEELNEDKIASILADFKPVELPKNKIMAQEKEEKKDKAQVAKEEKDEAQKKQLNELNVDEMYHLILHYLDELKVECNLEDLSNLLKNEMKLDGATFSTMKKKEFGSKLKTIGIKAGKAGKLFKELTQKVSVDEINEILSSMEKVAVEKEDTFAKPVEDLIVEEVMFIFTEIIANDAKLSKIKIDIDQFKEIVSKNELNGAKCKAMKRKEFNKMVKVCGLKAGHSSPLFAKLTKLQPDEVGSYLKQLNKEKEEVIQQKEDEVEKELEAKQAEDEQKAEGDIMEQTLESLNVQQFKTLFLCVLKEKNIETDDEKLQKCGALIIEQNIDGKMCKNTKAKTFGKLFKPIGIKGGPFRKAYKAITTLDTSEIGRKLLVSEPCNGTLEQCPNIQELCGILQLFHNKSREELLKIHLSKTETIKIINNYDHLTSKHALFGDTVHDLPEVQDENAADPEDLSNSEQYRQFQHKVYEFMISRLGACNSEGRNCYFINRHSRDIEEAENVKEIMNESNPMLLDTIASMHTFIFHNVEDQVYRLYDREAARTGEGDYGIDNTTITANNTTVNNTTTDSNQERRQRRVRRNNGLEVHYNHQAPNDKSSPLEDENSDEEGEEGVPSPGSAEAETRRPRRQCERFSTSTVENDSKKMMKKLSSKPKLGAFASLKQRSSLGVLGKHQALTSSIKFNLPDGGIHPDYHGGEIVGLAVHKPQLSKFATSMVKVDKKNEISAVNFGEKLDKWFSPLESALYKNVHDEVTLNLFEKIFEDTYIEINSKCEMLVKSQLNAMLFSLDELIAIKLYTDCDKLQSVFRRTFWSGTIKEQRLSFVHWALMLQSTVIYGAIPITFSVFHGLSNLFTVKKMLPIFHGPISTTTSANVATKFADTKGMLWRIEPRIWSQLENPMGIKVHWISRFEYEKEVLLMNCPLPIRKTKAFETGIHKKIEYLLDYLAKYNEPITDKKKFYTQVGLDKLVLDKFMGSELERLWLCDLGKSPNLWKVSKRTVTNKKKLAQWLNERATLKDSYWDGANGYVDKKVHANKHNFFKKMQKINDQIAEDQKVFCYGFVIKKLFESQKRAYQIEIAKLQKSYDTTHDPELQNEHNSRLNVYKTKLNHNVLSKNGACKILSLLRGLPINKVSETDPAINLFKGKKLDDIYNFMTVHINSNQIKLLKLNYSVYYRLVNELDMFYLPFAAFTRVVYNGPNISRQDRIDLDDDQKQKERLYAQRHATSSNLFLSGRYATIKHLDEGIPLLQEIVSKHKIRYRLQFRFRPDKQTNIHDSLLNYQALAQHFQDIQMDGKHLNRIRNDEFSLICVSVKLSKSANCIPSEIIKIFDEIVNGSIEEPEYDDDTLDVTSCDELYKIFSDKMKQHAKERKSRKERRKSEKYAWQFVDLDVDKIKTEMIYLNVAGCSNFQVLNNENIWNYKLMCCVVDEDPDKWICVDKGRYRIDLDCVVPENMTVDISSFGAMPRNRNRESGFHRNVWVFRSLHLKKNSRLQIQPFGYNFINKDEPENKEAPGNDFDLYDDYNEDQTDSIDFMFGSIRVFCYDSIIIDEGAQINVSGKGMYGSQETAAINIGRGGHIKWLNAKDKRNLNKIPEALADAVDIYSGGGYGSSGMPVIDYGNGQCHIIRGNSDAADNDSKESKVKLRGGDVYGEKELDTLYYGSSGGKGCIASNKAHYYTVSDRGGGIIELIAQRIENKGYIFANGKCGRPGGQWTSAGSGGSIKIKCKQFKNVGFIEAAGGKLPEAADKNTFGKDGKIQIDQNYQPPNGNGGDGRIAIYFDENLSKDPADALTEKVNVNPTPYVDTTDKCNASKLPQWQRPAL